MTSSRIQRHHECHAAHVRDWPLHAKVWAHWGIQGWVPAVVVGYTAIRVRVRFVGRAPGTGFDPLNYALQGVRAPNNLRPRRSGEKVPPRKQPHETCLFLSGAA